MTTLCYQSNQRGYVTIRNEGNVTEVPLHRVSAIGDADIDSTLEVAMDNPGVHITVPNTSKARGIAPRNHALRF
jgi:hypothetical protein